MYAIRKRRLFMSNLQIRHRFNGHVRNCVSASREICSHMPGRTRESASVRANGIEDGRALVFSISCVSGATMTPSRRSGTSCSSTCGYVTKITISLHKFRCVSQKSPKSRADERLAGWDAGRPCAQATARHSAGETYRFAAKLNMSHFSNPYPLSSSRRRNPRCRFCRQRRWRGRCSRLSHARPNRNRARKFSENEYFLEH